MVLQMHVFLCVYFYTYGQCLHVHRHVCTFFMYVDVLNICVRIYTSTQCHRSPDFDASTN